MWIYLKQWIRIWCFSINVNKKVAILQNNDKFKLNFGVNWVFECDFRLTTSSLCTSMKAENSSRRNLLVAIVLPSHEAWADGCPASISPDIAVAGFPPYGCCENGLMLLSKTNRKTKKKHQNYYKTRFSEKCCTWN